MVGGRVWGACYEQSCMLRFKSINPTQLLDQQSTAEPTSHELVHLLSEPLSKFNIPSSLASRNLPNPLQHNLFSKTVMLKVSRFTGTDGFTHSLKKFVRSDGSIHTRTHRLRAQITLPFARDAGVTRSFSPLSSYQYW